MIEREKVLKGLECCTIDPNRGVCPVDCPYFDLYYCDNALMKDAIELLKEQEAVPVEKTKAELGLCVYGGFCPKCKNWIQTTHSYCGVCGQAVKWDDT